MLRAGTRYPAIAALLLPPFTADELAAQVQRRAMQKSHSLVKVGDRLRGLDGAPALAQHILRPDRQPDNGHCNCR